MLQPSFKREDLKPRYDVTVMQEDEWHSYSGTKTSKIVTSTLLSSDCPAGWLLNAGSGVYELRANDRQEVTLDLFAAPIRGRQFPVCASVERLPFPAHCFAAVVCVGEVLAYCDPASAICEFARVLTPSGILISDYGSSRSFRRLLSSEFGRAAD